MTFTLADADALAELAHEGQMDVSDRSYAEHPRAVAALLGDAPEYLRMAALLHDVIEDTPLTASDLLQRGVPAVVVDVVVVLSRRADETYSDFIERIARAGPGPVLVKTADVVHNLGRIEALPATERRSLRKRYIKALARLVQTLGSYSV